MTRIHLNLAFNQNFPDFIFECLKILYSDSHDYFVVKQLKLGNFLWFCGQLVGKSIFFSNSGSSNQLESNLRITTFTLFCRGRYRAYCQAYEVDSSRCSVLLLIVVNCLPGLKPSGPVEVTLTKLIFVVFRFIVCCVESSSNF